MTVKTRATTKAPTLVIAAALLAATAGPALGKKEKRQPIEKFRANAISMNLGAAKTLDITIYEWTTPEERQALLQTLAEGGSKALYEALDEQSEKGYVRLPGTLGYDMQYAFEFEVEGKRRIVLATDRPMAFIELMRSSRSTDYNVSLLVLDVDPETGEGEGRATAGAELSLDEETGQLVIEFAGTQPTRLTKVKPVAVKKK